MNKKILLVIVSLGLFFTSAMNAAAKNTEPIGIQFTDEAMISLVEEKSGNIVVLDENNLTLAEYHTDGFYAKFEYDENVCDGLAPVKITDNRGMTDYYEYDKDELIRIKTYNGTIQVSSKEYTCSNKKSDNSRLEEQRSYTPFNVYHSDGSTRQMNCLISNANFVKGSNSLTQPQIQSFLSTNNSVLTNYIYVYRKNSNGVVYNTGIQILPSQTIYDAANSYSISPKVVMATMQKETSIIVGQPNAIPSEYCFYFCMGAGSPSNPNHTGFIQQLELGTSTLRSWYNSALSFSYPYYYSNSGFYGYHGYGHTGYDTSIWCDNAATYSLYKYTNYTILDNDHTGTCNESFLDILDKQYMQNIPF